MLGSSLPFPAGLSSACVSLTISSVISTFPYKVIMWHAENRTTGSISCKSGLNIVNIYIFKKGHILCRSLTSWKHWQTNYNIYFIHWPQVLSCHPSPCSRATSLSLTAEQTETWRSRSCSATQSPHHPSLWGSTSQGSWLGPPGGADPAPGCLQSQCSATVRFNCFCKCFPSDCSLQGWPQPITCFHLTPPSAYSSLTPITWCPVSLHPDTTSWFFLSCRSAPASASIYLIY